MTKDRQIVAMLLKRKRSAWRHLLHSERIGNCAEYKAMLMAAYIEASNCAEYSRRILYDLDT